MILSETTFHFFVLPILSGFRALFEGCGNFSVALIKKILLYLCSKIPHQE